MALRRGGYSGARKGHNLLEVVIASTIFSTVLIFLVLVWMQHSRSLSALGTRLVAQHLAQEVMEECVEAGPEHVDALTVPRPAILVQEKNRNTVVNIAYKVTVTVNPLGPGNADPTSHCKTVQVTIAWHDSLGDSQLDYRTLVAVPPP